MDCSPPGSSVHGIFQARVLKWVATSFSRGSSWLRDQTQVSHIVGRRFTVWATRELQSQVEILPKLPSSYVFLVGPWKSTFCFLLSSYDIYGNYTVLFVCFKNAHEWLFCYRSPFDPSSFVLLSIMLWDPSVMFCVTLANPFWWLHIILVESSLA